MNRIAWVNEDSATGEVADVYGIWKQANPDRESLPDILKCFSARPDFLKQVMEFSYNVHFRDGHLTRRVKEMIATYVSALNHCQY